MAEEAPRDSTSKFKAAALAAQAAAVMSKGRQDPEYLRVSIFRSSDVPFGLNVSIVDCVLQLGLRNNYYKFEFFLKILKNIL